MKIIGDLLLPELGIQSNKIHLNERLESGPRDLDCEHAIYHQSLRKW